MMDFDSLKDEVLDIVCGIIEVDRDFMLDNLDSNLFEELKVDSLLALEIAADLEKKFDIRIDDEDIEDLVTFNKLIDYVKKKMESTAAVSL